MKSRIKMNYPSLLLSLTGGTREQLTPHVNETRTEQAALLDAALPKSIDGELHRRRHLYYCDPCDLAHRLSYLVGPLAGANDDGGGHGGVADMVYGDTPAMTARILSRDTLSCYPRRRF